MSGQNLYKPFEVMNIILSGAEKCYKCGEEDISNAMLAILCNFIEKYKESNEKKVEQPYLDNIHLDDDDDNLPF